jgi:hypothetical protein
MKILVFLFNKVSTFWKDSPSSYYWDVWNSKLIKTDDNGIQVGSVSGYGCSCEGNIIINQIMKQELALNMIIRLDQ